ncbi:MULTISPECIES: cell division protein FtsQ/DivIB [Corynebacterium]|uniref:cell division protein FtsQ/DivIB n=1 Tax=Corynebacterium TaxID=1716 RepID=UPI00188B2F69|nr:MULTISPECIES: FtsQ-type POTRA domain-containing protein [Corynebacterium]MBF4546879.1 FtsQ-type POTRA domain-containing protein [Corynebacterium afermentans subsp. lipophilum]MCG7290275.1 FtsQ-type POTRA domain-containing protein [Corynebacterium sp. ACRPZ]MCG7294393.1 FtsQ-type POTRA domain-containing protein [Corynebacterium sp. ACRPY]WJY59239.1 Cell division protein FtsQ [Corynebacterium afermentans subsp. lipophilum]
MSRRAIAIVAGCVALVLAVVAVLPFTPAMPVDDVNVEGAVNLPAEEVKSLSGVETGTPMGRVDVRRAAQDVAANPWVDSVTVKRNWPNAVDVTVVEHTPVAWIDQGGEPHLINSEGKDFVVAQPPVGAVQLVGISEEQLPKAVEVASAITDVARPQVRELTRDGDHSFVLKLDGDRTVTWGASEDNRNKALALETVLQLDGKTFNISNPELVTSR